MIKNNYLIVVLYNEKLARLRRLLKLCKENNFILSVFDNRFKKKNLRIFNFERLLYMTGLGNIGIPAAQNKILRYIHDNNLNGLILFSDDDTDFSSYDFELAKSIASSQIFSRSLIFPEVINSYSGLIVQGSRESNIPMEIDQAMCAGTLVNYETLKDIGMFREDLFIDLVDYEYYWRAKSKGYKLVLDGRLKIKNKSGAGSERLMGVNIRFPSPFRWYYITRNYLKLISVSYVPIEFKVKYFFITPVKIILHCIFIKSIQPLKYGVKGIKDYFKGKDNLIN